MTARRRPPARLAVLLCLLAGCAPIDPAADDGPATRPTAWVVGQRQPPQPFSAERGTGGSATAGPAGAADPTGTGWAAAPVTAVPSVPRTTPQAADYATPEAVARTYFAAWCHQPPSAAGDTAVDTPTDNATDTPTEGTRGGDRAVAWLTVDGWRDDTARAATDPPLPPRVGTVCGPVQADPVAGAPRTQEVVWVGIQARQVWVRDGQVLGDHPVGQVRRVVRTGVGGPDRWLVDVRVNAG